MSGSWWSARGPIRRPSRSSTGATCPASMPSPTAGPEPSRSPRTSPRRPSSARSATSHRSAGGPAASARGCSGSSRTSSSTTTGGPAAPRRDRSADAARGLLPDAASRDPADEVGERDAVAEVLAAMDRLSPRYQQALALRYLAGPQHGRGRGRDGHVQGHAGGRRPPGHPRPPSGPRRGGPVVSDDTRRRLEEAGGRPVPQPDPDVRRPARGAAAGGRRDVAGPARAHRTRPLAGRRRRSIALALAAAERRSPSSCAITVGTPNGQPGPAPLLAGPVNVTVALTDGTVVDATDGLSLPDGAVVTVGEGGYARIGDQVLHAGRRGHDRARSAPDRPRPPDRRRDADPGPRHHQADDPADPEAHAGPESHAQADGPADPQANAEDDAGPGSHAEADPDARTDAHAHAPGRDGSAAHALAVAGAAHVPAAAPRPRQPRRRPGRAALDRDAPRGELPADRDPVARRPGAGSRLPGLPASSASSPPRRTTGCGSGCSTRSSRSR